MTRPPHDDSRPDALRLARHRHGGEAAHGLPADPWRVTREQSRDEGYGHHA